MVADFDVGAAEAKTQDDGHSAIGLVVIPLGEDAEDMAQEGWRYSRGWVCPLHEDEADVPSV